MAIPALDAVFQDPMCVARGDDVWVSYAQGDEISVCTEEATPGDSVRVLHSGDRGETFDDPVVASDVPAGSHVLLPQLAIVPSGALELVYYQGEDGEPAALVHAESRTWGASFTQGEVALPGTFSTPRNSGLWLGDYIGLAAGGQALVVAYSDNSVEDTSHIAFAATAP